MLEQGIVSLRMDKTFTITLSEADLQVVNQALVQIPYKYAAPLIQKINQQIQLSVSNTQDFEDSAKQHGSELM
jgi:hypothetical protein